MSDSESKRITVVMPVRNGEKYIVESIKSILSQTYKNFRFLIVDDNSTDQTTNLVREFTDSRIELVSNRYAPGRCGALNYSYELCNSEYIANMDADDISNPERFERQISFMDNNPEIGVLGTHIVKFLNNKPSERTLIKYPLSHIDCKDQLLSRSACFANPTTLIRRSFIPRNLRFRDKFWCAEDYKYYSEISMHTKLANIPYIGLHYRIHDKNLSVVHMNEQESQSKKIQFELFRLMLKNSLDSDEMGTLKEIIEQDTSVSLEKISTLLKRIHEQCNEINCEKLKRNFIKQLVREGKLKFSFDRNTDIQSYAKYIRYNIKYRLLRKLTYKQ